jgi:hypothetical protein
MADSNKSFRYRVVTGINDWCCCTIIGQCGLPCLWDSRKSLLHLCYVFTLFSAFCSIFACISIRASQNSTIIASWTSASGSIVGVDTYMWVGLSGSVWETTTSTSYILWEDTACTNNQDSTSNEYCNNCNSGGNTAVGLMLLAVVTRFPSIILLKSRMENANDLPLIKIFGIFSEVLAAFAQAAALFVWREYCHKNLPYQSDLDYTAGTGFILAALGLAITFCLAIVHLLIPTLDPKDKRSVFYCGCCASDKAVVENHHPSRHATKDPNYTNVATGEPHHKTKPQKPIDRGEEKGVEIKDKERKGRSTSKEANTHEDIETGKKHHKKGKH